MKNRSPRTAKGSSLVGSILGSRMWMFIVALTVTATVSINAQSSNADFDPNANDAVNTIAIQADGKILIGGLFYKLAPDGGAEVTRNRIARLNTDGTVDMTFDPYVGGGVGKIVVQPDGKILVGGGFTFFAPNGGAIVTRNNIGRLNANGTVDTTFDPNANGGVDALAVQADGKIIIGGSFTTLRPNGGVAVTRNRIARLNTDGTVDTTFDPNISLVGLAGPAVQVLVVQPDGKILVGGFFNTFTPNGSAAVTRWHIARLNTDGTVDMTFDPHAGDRVTAIAMQSDGKIIIGGFFTSLEPNGGEGVTRNRIARLNTDGTLAQPLNTGANNRVFSLAVQADDKILVGGIFTFLLPNGGAAVRRNRIGRLNADGTLDTTFNPNASSTSEDNSTVVYALTVQADGKILVGGGFTTFTPNGGAPITRNRIARLNTDGTVDAVPRVTQLAQSTYTVAENEPTGEIRIEVVRTGSTTQPSTIDYVTTNNTTELFNCNPVNYPNGEYRGIATSRCDYTLAVGTLSFAAGESSKTISIPISNDTHVEGAETFTVSLRNPIGATLGSSATATITIADDDTTNQVPNPYSNNSFFSRQQYLDFFGRNPSDSEVATWANVMMSNCGEFTDDPADGICYDRTWIASKGFFQSDEFQQKGYYAYRFYKLLGRTRLPLYAEFKPDIVSLTNTTEETKNRFVQQFMQRADYLAVYPANLNNEQFVDKLVSTTGLTTLPAARWKEELNSVRKTKAQVLREVVESQELFTREFNEAWVVMHYFAFLQRDGSASEYASWKSVFDRNPNDWRTVSYGFVTSTEYKQRFGDPQR